jgi:hypothetical protein
MFGRGKKEKVQRLFETGSKGIGTVISVQDTGMTINDNPRVKMLFRIEPIDRSPAFEAEKTTTVSRVMIPRQGDRYPVWYDREDPSTWAYAVIADDDGRQQIRAQFGAAADSCTGMGGAPAPAPAVTATPGAPAPDGGGDPLDRLKKLSELHAAGVISDAEFEQQKQKLLSML